jgi:Smr domain
MSSRKPSKDKIHEEMLRHLERNPPRASAPKQPPKPSPPAPPKPEMPRLMLRKLRLVTALERLERFVRFHSAHGTPELLLIVGKGQNSADGKQVLAPAVRDWCARSSLVAGIEPAPERLGGQGALVVALRSRP